MPTRPSARATIAAGLFLLTACGNRAPPSLAEIYFDEIPDLPQRGPDFDFPGEGETLCAPVAVSNSLVWLAGETDFAQQIGLVNRLSGHRYMGSSPRRGTSPAAVIHGVREYLAEAGRKVQRLEYAGWRPVDEKHQAGEPLTVEWLVSGLGPQSAVWLNLGWYENPVPGYFHRTGGHWAVLVGYRQGRLLINDPGPWADNADPQALTAWELRPLLLRTERELLLPGPRIIELKTARSPDTRGAYIDGAIILELGGPWREPR